MWYCRLCWRSSGAGFLLEGLSKLEYRGYDSAGIAVYNDGAIAVRKKEGRIANLYALVKEQPCYGTIGIGHTRWATHGGPSDINAHPHVSADGTFAVVHNGIIENYMAIKEELIEKATPSNQKRIQKSCQCFARNYTTATLPILFGRSLNAFMDRIPSYS